MTQHRLNPGRQETLPDGGAARWRMPSDEIGDAGRRQDQPPWNQRGYGVLGEATGEELALLRVFGIALILLLIIVGMALSQYVICLFACNGHSSL